MSERFEGTVKWFNAEKGYGFIERADGGDDVFLHFSDLDKPGYKTIEENQRVEFSLEQGAKGLKAVNVTEI